MVDVATTSSTLAVSPRPSGWAWYAGESLHIVWDSCSVGTHAQSRSLTMHIIMTIFSYLCSQQLIPLVHPIPKSMPASCTCHAKPPLPPMRPLPGIFLACMHPTTSARRFLHLSCAHTCSLSIFLPFKYQSCQSNLLSHPSDSCNHFHGWKSVQLIPESSANQSICMPKTQLYNPYKRTASLLASNLSKLGNLRL